MNSEIKVIPFGAWVVAVCVGLAMSTFLVVIAMPRDAKLAAWPSSCGLKAFTKTLASTVYRRLLERDERIGTRGTRRAGGMRR